jgi:hypothetical protein
MPAKARMQNIINEAEERVKAEFKAKFPNVLKDGTAVSGPDASSKMSKTLSARDLAAFQGTVSVNRRGIKHLKTLVSKRNYEAVVMYASELISAKQKLSCKKSPQNAEIFNYIESEIYYIRGFAASQLNNHELGMDDATFGLQLVLAMREALSQCEEKTDRRHRNSSVSIGDAQRELKIQECLLLKLRSQCSKNLGDLDGSLVDARAAVALIFSNNLEIYNRDYVTQVLIVLACKNAGLCRPHFSDLEVHFWNKELRIKMYSRENHVCFNCGQGASEGEKLKICGDCKKVWFCGTACLKTAWPKHKPCCRCKLKIVTAIPIKMEAMVRSEIAKNGFYIALDRNGPAVVILDSKTGSIHESLSDQEVLFLNEDDPDGMQEALSRHCGIPVSPGEA